MLTYSSSVTIVRTPEQVFQYLVDPQKQALWSDVPMRPITNFTGRTGTRMEVTFAGGPLKAVVGLELTDVQPSTRMAFKSFSGPIRWQGEYVLEPTADGGTLLSQNGTLQFTGLWRLLEPLAGREIKSGEIKELERLKSVVEAS